MKKYFISALFCVLSLTVSLNAQDFIQTASGQTVLLGTYNWDIETDSFPYSANDKDYKTRDIWWHQIDQTRQELFPNNSAVLAEVTDKQFWELTAEDLQNLKYSANPIPNTKLKTDAVIAMRTSDGNLAKLRVVGYRALHDFSFKEAEILRASWKRFVLNRENREKYHLEVEWVLYAKQNRF